MAKIGTTALVGKDGKAVNATPGSGKDRRGLAMNKALYFIVLLSFIFSSCATAPVANHSQKLSTQVRVYPFINPYIGYTNTSTLAFKDYSSFRILDTKVAEPTEDTKSDAKAEKSSSNNTALFLQIGVCLAIGGYLAYDYFTNPDSFLKK